MKAKISIRVLIAITFVFIVVIMVFNFYDIAVDKSDKYAYTKEDIQQLEIEKVNINTADVTQLCTLPSIGEKTANDIIEYRKTYGYFEKTEDIKNVRNIGERTYLEIRSMITV